MKRRFGRGRRGRNSGDIKNAPVDPARCFERIVEEKLVAASELEPLKVADIPASFAVVATGTSEDGRRLVVGFSPRVGGDAALAAVAVAQRLVAEEGFEGEAIAIAPQWTIASRRRLEALGTLPFAFRALAASSLGEGGVELESGAEPWPVPARQVVAQLAAGAERDRLERALTAFEGLAAKHGGAVRGVGASVELVLLARRVAVLRIEADGTHLEILHPERSTERLEAGSLATTFDRLEGMLRKHLNDRRVRAGDEGLRGQLAPVLAEAAGVRGAKLWPLGGSEPEVVDFVGVGEDGGPIVAALRATLNLSTLGALLDALPALRAALPTLLADVEAPVRLGAPRLLLAAKQFDDAVLRVLPALSLGHANYDVRPRRGREPQLVLRAAPEAPSATQPAADEAGVREERGRESADATGGRRFEEISLFDLDDEARPAAGEAEERGPRRRRRNRGRRRGGRGASGGNGGAEGEAAPRASRAAAKRFEEAPPPQETVAAAEDRPGEDERTPEVVEEANLLEADVDEDLSATLVPLDEEVPDPEEVLAPAYDDDEEELAEEGAEQPDLLELERAARRRARLAKITAKPEAEVEENPRIPRRRAAIVAHADRDSLTAAILLARDLRLVEGFWIYPQPELMTFFRSIATDLRSDTPIYVVGFVATPAKP
jgi:hypothetical protein